MELFLQQNSSRLPETFQLIRKNMLDTLFKPKWQHKNADVRLKALQKLEANSEALIALALNDSDQQVRQQATQHLSHVSSLLEIAQKNSTETKDAKQRLTQLVQAGEVSPQQMDAVYPYVKNENLNQQIAASADYSGTLRKNVIATIKDQALLFRIASDDTAKDIQFVAAQQLTDHQQIKKLEKHTKNNKRLRQLLKERMAQQSAHEAWLQQLEQICKESEQLGQYDKWDQDKTNALRLQSQWGILIQQSNDVPNPLIQRYESAQQAFNEKYAVYLEQEEERKPIREQQKNLIERARNLLDQLRHHTETLSAEPLQQAIKSLNDDWSQATKNLPTIEQAELNQQFDQTAKQIKTLASTVLDDLKTLARFDKLVEKAESINNRDGVIDQKQLAQLKKQWNNLDQPRTLDHRPQKERYLNLLNRLDARLQREAEQQDTKIESLRKLVNQMEQAIATNQLGDAIDHHHRAQRLLPSLKNAQASQLKPLQSRLQQAGPIIREAKDWRHWGTDNAREQLISTAENLIEDTGISPTDREKKLRELRSEWKKLTKIDPQQHQALWERFDQACTKAYEPCKHYHEQQAQQRNSNLQARAAICEQLETLASSFDWEQSPDLIDWKSINEAIQKQRKAWKSAGTVDRKQWKEVNDRFNNAMDALEIHLDKERQRNFAMRSRLLEQAEQLVNYEVITDAIETAKQLQASWKTTITAKQSAEQKLWKQFRAAINAVFEHQKQQRADNKAALLGNLDAKQSVLNELESWLALDNESFKQRYSDLTQKESEFEAIADIPKSKQDELNRQLKQLQKRLQQKLEQGDQEKRQQQLQLFIDKATLCSLKEQGETIADEAWDELDKLKDNKLENQISKRFKQTDAIDETNEHLSELLIEIEILLDLSTPKAFQQQRMQYQIQKLPELMLSANSKEDNMRLAIDKVRNYLLTTGSRANDERFATIAKAVLAAV